jgi:uncharacterized protein YqeY
VRTELRRDLTIAIRARDRIRMSALRSALAAIENAEAVDTPDPPRPPGGDGNVGGSTPGLGAGEGDRKVLSAIDEQELLRHEVQERRASAAHYEQLGRPDRAEHLHAEAEVLAAYLGSEPEPAP